MEGVPLKEVDNVKYLGHILGNHVYPDDLVQCNATENEDVKNEE